MEISLFVALPAWCIIVVTRDMLKGPWEALILQLFFAGKAVHGQLFAGTEAYFESYLLFWSAGTIAISVSGCLDCWRMPQRSSKKQNSQQFFSDVKGMPTLHSRHCLYNMKSQQTLHSRCDFTKGHVSVCYALTSLWARWPFPNQTKKGFSFLWILQPAQSISLIPIQYKRTRKGTNVYIEI